jgi:hypothetical protein
MWPVRKTGTQPGRNRGVQETKPPRFKTDEFLGPLVGSLSIYTKNTGNVDESEKKNLKTRGQLFFFLNLASKLALNSRL